MADWNTPVITTAYVSVLDSLKNRDIDSAVMFSPTYATSTNLPTGTIRWNPTNGYWEIRDGLGSWNALQSKYMIDVDKLDGQDGSFYLAWANLTGVPSTFAPSAHTHDDRYFTESESDARFGNKLVTSGNTIKLQTPGNVDLATITVPYATNAGTVAGYSVGQSLLTTSSVTFDSLGIGTSTGLNYNAKFRVLAASNQNYAAEFYAPGSNNKSLVMLANDNGIAGIGSSGSNLVFMSAGEIERMRLDISGNLGLGTTTPTRKLDVVSTSAFSTARFASGGADYVGIVNQTLYSSASLYSGVYYQIHNELGNQVANMRADVFTDGGSAWVWTTQAPGDRTNRTAERMRLESNGNLGIGTASPTTMLDVNGTVTSTGLRLTGTGDAALASTGHAFQIGPTTGANLIIDQNEIMARSNGTAVALALNADGGNITLGAASSTVTVAGTLSIPASSIGSAEIAAGAVVSSKIQDGAIILSKLASGVYACRAWVNFNGTNTVAMRASGNVSSITDGGVGIYTVNFTNAMPDVNYAIVGFATDNNNSGDPVVVQRWSSDGYAAGSVTIRTTGAAASAADSPLVNVAVFR